MYKIYDVNIPFNIRFRKYNIAEDEILVNDLFYIHFKEFIFENQDYLRYDGDFIRKIKKILTKYMTFNFIYVNQGVNITKVDKNFKVPDIFIDINIEYLKDIYKGAYLLDWKIVYNDIKITLEKALRD